MINIILGWWYLLTNRNHELAYKRLKICNKCKYRKWFICSVCTCPLKAKVRYEEEECPKGFWKAEGQHSPGSNDSGFQGP